MSTATNAGKHLRTVVIAAVFTALTAVATMVVQIPSPMQGYVNLGDCFVLLSAWILGPIYGTAAAAIGSAMADILTGYLAYAPGTFVIKGAMALAAALLFMAIAGASAKAPRKNAARVVAAVAAEAIMVIGYFGYAGLIFGEGLAAAASIPGNLMQGAIGLVSGCVLAGVLDKLDIHAH